MHGFEGKLKLLHSLSKFSDDRNRWDVAAWRNEGFMASKNRVLQFPTKNYLYFALDFHAVLLEGRSLAVNSLLYKYSTICAWLVVVWDMSQSKPGKHVTPGGSHWGLHHDNEPFVFAGSQLEHDWLLQCLVDRIFDSPAFELSFRVDSQACVIWFKGQIFWTERSKKLFYSFRELFGNFING